MRTPELQARALQLGARGFVLKKQSAPLLVRAIRKVLEGELWFGRETVGHAVTRMLKGPPRAPTPI